MDIMQEYIPFFQAEKRSIAEKLAKYFEYSGLETKIHYDEKDDVYILSVPSSNEKEAKKLYQAFYFVERDRIEKEEKEKKTSFDDANIPSDSIASFDDANIPSDSLALSDTTSIPPDIEDKPDDVNNPSTADEDVQLKMAYDETAPTNISDLPVNMAVDTDDGTTQPKDQIENAQPKDDMSVTEGEANPPSSVNSLLSGSGSYVMKSEKYKDYISTQYVFLILGVAGIIFVILNAIGLLTFLNGIFPNLIMGALFLFFVMVGISTAKKARQLKLEIDDEIQLTDKINNWLRSTVTEEFLASISNKEVSEELDYIKKTDAIRDMLVNEFGEQDRDYLDRLIEEFYSENFDKTESYTEKE